MPRFQAPAIRHCRICNIDILSSRFERHMAHVHARTDTKSANEIGSLEPFDPLDDRNRLPQRESNRVQVPEVTHERDSSAENYSINLHPPLPGDGGRPKRTRRRCELCGVNLPHRETCIYLSAPIPTTSPRRKKVRRPTKRNASPPRTLELCSVCGVPVREDRLAKHLRTVHSAMGKSVSSTRAKPQRPPTAPRPPKTSSRSSPSTKAPVATERGQYEIEGNLDYTRKHQYSTNYREQGRFGSHPSHDDYSDEGDA
jgi:hypothetical protein